MYLSNLGRIVGSAIGVLSLSLHASVQTAPPSGGAKNDRYPCLPPMTYDSAIGRNPCLPLMIRTEVPALPGFGSAGLAFEECVRAGRACDTSQRRDC